MYTSCSSNTAFAVQESFPTILSDVETVCCSRSQILIQKTGNRLCREIFLIYRGNAFVDQDRSVKTLCGGVCEPDVGFAQSCIRLYAVFKPQRGMQKNGK